MILSDNPIEEKKLRCGSNPIRHTKNINEQDYGNATVANRIKMMAYVPS